MVLFVGFFFLIIFLHYQQTLRHVHTIMIDNLRENTINMKLDIKVILKNHKDLNLKAYLDRQKAASRMVENIYVVKDDGILVRTSDYLYDKKVFYYTNSINMRELTPENIMHIAMIQFNINIISEGKKVGYKIYIKTNTDYIVESVQKRVLAQVFYPLLFFVGIVMFYILYIKRMIIKPIIIIDDFLRGLIQRIPKFYILELDNLAKNLQENIKKLTNLAYYDTLTGLYNREAIDDMFLGEIRSAEKKDYNFSVALLDLDYFKKVNDSHGHDVGDQLLKEVAVIIRTIAGGKEKIGRLGGDEFLILFDPSTKDVSATLQAINERLEKPINVKGHDFYMGLSIGVVSYPVDGTDVSTLLKRVDMSMYQAKEEGRNRIYYYSEELGNKIKEEFALEEEIKHALEYDEFFLQYQPIVNVDDKKVVAAEALIRWNHPSKGLVYPDNFIPFIEKGCCTKEVGELVYEEAFKQQKVWLREGIDIILSINLSVKHILSTDFYKHMNKLVEKYNMDLTKIRLEITEYTLMEHRETTIKILTQMQEQGFQFSLDDFGTGYSSITYLKDTPISSIKIDKSFIDEITHDNSGEAQFFDAIVTLSKVIGLSSIAEGAEEEYQVEYLKKSGCDMIQGYYYSKPLNPKEFNTYMRQSISSV